MKNFIVTCASLILLSFKAQAALLLKANMQGCGPYPYKQTSLGFVLNLPILESNTISQGFLISKEEANLATFLSGWLDFFVNNGERKLQFKTLCYGFYDDENSTGPNALAYGTEAMLIGTQMMKQIKVDIDAFVTERFKYWNPNQQVNVKGLKSNAAQDFVIFHEFAHFLQNVHGYAFSGPTAKMKELNADCVGASLFTLGRIANNLWSSDDMLAGMMYAYALGDGNVTSSKHHGFPDDRLNAFSVGMANVINMRNVKVDLTKLKSQEIIEACRIQYR